MSSASVSSSWHTAHDIVQACSQLHWGHAATFWPVGCGPNYCKSVLLKWWSMQQCPFANCMLPVCSVWKQKFKSKQLGTLTAIWYCPCIQAAFPFSSHSFLWKYWSLDSLRSTAVSHSRPRPLKHLMPSRKVSSSSIATLEATGPRCHRYRMKKDHQMHTRLWHEWERNIYYVKLQKCRHVRDT